MERWSFCLWIRWGRSTQNSILDRKFIGKVGGPCLSPLLRRPLKGDMWKGLKANSGIRGSQLPEFPRSAGSHFLYEKPRGIPFGGPKTDRCLKVAISFEKIGEIKASTIKSHPHIFSPEKKNNSHKKHSGSVHRNFPGFGSWLSSAAQQPTAPPPPSRELLRGTEAFLQPELSWSGCFLKWWYPQNTPKWSFSVGKPMVVGYHHVRKPPSKKGPKIFTPGRWTRILSCYAFHVSLVFRTLTIFDHWKIPIIWCGSWEYGAPLWKRKSSIIWSKTIIFQVWSCSSSGVYWGELWSNNFRVVPVSFNEKDLDS